MTENTYRIEDELNMLDPKQVKLTKDAFNRLKLVVADDREYPEVRAVMGFPLTDPDSLISLVTVKNGKKDEEIGVLEDLKQLDRKSRRLLREELEREYFMPRITKINAMKEHHGIMQFDVETEQGPRAFETRYKEDIRKLGGGAIVITDADGNRYEIEDYRKLDVRSTNLIDTEV